MCDCVQINTVKLILNPFNKGFLFLVILPSACLCTMPNKFYMLLAVITGPTEEPVLPGKVSFNAKFNTR